MLDYTFDGRVLEERCSARAVGALDGEYMRDAEGRRVGENRRKKP